MVTRARAAGTGGWVGCILGVVVAAAGCKGNHAGLTLDGGGPSDGHAPATGDSGMVGPSSGAGTASGPEDGAPPDDSIPATISDDLTMRARHLLEAISKDDADLAVDILFPRSGWIDLRDVDDPGRDWDARVDRPFRRSIHALSKRADGAQFVSLELGHAVVQESPHHHGWKKGLWTVHGSRLTYLLDGHTRTLTLHELTAWRGAWYVTRLR